MAGLNAYSLAFSLSLIAACSPPRENFADSGNTSGTPDVAADIAAVVDGGMVCTDNAGCDDHRPCTVDLCVIGGLCQHASTCPSGMFCNATGCSTTVACTTNADCDDTVACTQDICGTGGACQNLRDDSRCDATTMQTCSVTLGCVARGRCGIDADCDDNRFCNGMERCATNVCQSGTAMGCDDHDACTADQCVESTRMCAHTPLTPCGGTPVSGTYALSPVPQFTCSDGSIGPVNSVMLTVTATSVTVTGFGTTLTGGAPEMGMFTASGPWTSSGCGGTISFSGSFTMPGYFMGSWSLTAGMCHISCNSHFDRTNGTLQH